MDEGGILSPFGILQSVHSVIQNTPLRKSFSVGDEALLKKVGTYPVVSIDVCRSPIATYVKKLLGVITLGEWQKTQDTLGVDKVFHTFLKIVIRDPRTSIESTLIFEKNETPTVHVWDGKTDPETECMRVTKLVNTNMNWLIMNTKNEMLDDFWKYNPFTNNCVVATKNMLGSNGLLTPELDKFLNQPIQDFESHLPAHTGKVATYLTDTSRKLRTLTGLGLPMHNPNGYEGGNLAGDVMGNLMGPMFFMMKKGAEGLGNIMGAKDDVKNTWNKIKLDFSSNPENILDDLQSGYKSVTGHIKNIPFIGSTLLS